MSKGDVIRGFVTERLAAASQEILAVVDKIVAGYEEEASGFRQEIERQRMQLEELLQPEVRLKAGQSLKIYHPRNAGFVDVEGAPNPINILCNLIPAWLF